MSSKFATVRLARELSKLRSETGKVDGITINEPENIMKWTAIMKGPPETPYEDGIFEMELKFDDDYPVKPPSVKFITPMFHPNIYRDGKICIDILQSHEWTPAQNIVSILVSIRSLLMDPNPSSPANRDAAVIYEQSKEKYNQKVREFIKQQQKR
jgi:ubiquitin-conjugating enzyme E2 A